ncbi:hypothetical protein N7509_009877 [Penicillium cosmopolitanum]|uniref:Peptidase S8/S53 domain-containing protein n=1 Tax=Penicillium cosmopolitanum TaxID=1131564 RepID=A0A9X0B434_9EURO|nr:uncharacterized protein N7509_009877 [Penicillium cosmopolitanum]KAJ5387336.1 hypothetical protein N7509_009877 [Penicillium cosmopolitanum]
MEPRQHDQFQVKEESFAYGTESLFPSQHGLPITYQNRDRETEKTETLCQLECTVMAWERAQGEENFSLLGAQHNLAVAYRKNGQTQKAIGLLEHVVTVRKKILPELDPYLLGSQYDLAVMYRTCDRVHKAVQLLEHVMAVGRRAWPEDTSLLVSSSYQLALAYRAGGQIKEAVQHFEHVVAVRERTLPENDSSLLRSQYQLAVAYRINGQIKEAVQLFGHVVTLQEKTLAEEDPSLLWSQHNLAVAYRSDGQIEKALELLEHVVAVRQRTRTEDDPALLASKHDLAVAYWSGGQNKKAVQLFENVVGAQKRLLGEEDSSLLASMCQLALMYQTDAVRNAVHLLKDVITMQERTTENHLHRNVPRKMLENATQIENLIQRAVHGFDLMDAHAGSQALDLGSPLQQSDVAINSPFDSAVTTESHYIRGRVSGGSEFENSDINRAIFELFGVEDQGPPSSRECENTKKWMSLFNHLRTDFGIGREPERIKVAIIDTGFDINHPRLNGENRIKEYKSFNGGDVTVDTSGHGTHIAGILLELTSNVDLYIEKFVNSRICGEEENITIRERIVRALRHARETWKVHMISLSFGFNKTGTRDEVKEEVEECLNNNIVVFASASNDGGNRPRTYPGKYNRVLCIHSASGVGDKSWFSPTPEEPDTKQDNFSAVGDCVSSYWPLNDPNVANVGSKYMSGTSFATPVAVSIAAFMLGYIQRKIPHYDWNIKPRSPEGIQKIFRMMSKGNKRDGYDWISPQWFFGNYLPEKIKSDLIHEPQGYKC